LAGLAQVGVSERERGGGAAQLSAQALNQGRRHASNDPRGMRP
jgi:hypothetical protein